MVGTLVLGYVRCDRTGPDAGRRVPHWGGLVGAIIGTMLLLLVYRQFAARRTHA